LEYNATPYLSKAESISTHESRRKSRRRPERFKVAESVRENRWGRSKADQEAPARYALYQQRIHSLNNQAEAAY